MGASVITDQKRSVISRTGVTGVCGASHTSAGTGCLGEQSESFATALPCCSLNSGFTAFVTSAYEKTGFLYWVSIAPALHRSPHTAPRGSKCLATFSTSTHYFLKLSFCALFIFCLNPVTLFDRAAHTPCCWPVCKVYLTLLPMCKLERASLNFCDSCLKSGESKRKKRWQGSLKWVWKLIDQGFVSLQVTVHGLLSSLTLR